MTTTDAVRFTGEGTDFGCGVSLLETTNSGIAIVVDGDVRGYTIVAELEAALKGFKVCPTCKRPR